MSHAQELLDVVILTWNDAALLDTAVDSVLASTGVEVSVVVVDNGSVPPARVVQDARVQQLRNEQNRGVAAARNQGCRVRRAEYVCFLDSDAWVEPPALAALVQVLRQDPTVALVGPVFAGQRPTASGGRAPSLGRKVARALGFT
jgi:GT2 family glycosyltransferase